MIWSVRNKQDKEQMTMTEMTSPDTYTYKRVKISVLSISIHVILRHDVGIELAHLTLFFSLYLQF